MGDRGCDLAREQAYTRHWRIRAERAESDLLRRDVRRQDPHRGWYLALGLFAALTAALSVWAATTPAPGPMSACLAELASAGVDPVSTVAIVTVSRGSCCYVSTRERVCFSWEAADGS